MNNKFILIGAVVIILVAGILLIKGSPSGKAVLENTGNEGIQIVKLSVENGKYIMNPSEIKKEIPVRLDMTKMPGCSKSIVRPSFTVRKTFSSQDNKVEFTPDKAGTFSIACSMNMYQGTFTVLDSDGSKSGYVESSSPIGSSCGISDENSEGCGC
jgi:plastocyanin domain-containing protein